MACDHSALHSGEARYLRDDGPACSWCACATPAARCARRSARSTTGRVRDGWRTSRRADCARARPRRGADRASAFRGACVRQCRDRIPWRSCTSAAPGARASGCRCAATPNWAPRCSTTSASRTSASGSSATASAPTGSGYPRGLHGEQIPLEARILAVTDAYSAIVSDRPTARTQPRARLRRALRCAGTQFDGRSSTRS